MSTKSLIQNAFSKGEGILQLAPCWVPRPFNRPGKRLKLHPDDYYAYGIHAGAIVERWFCSSTRALTKGGREDCGLSYVNTNDTHAGKVLFMEALDELGAAIIGDELKAKFGTWPMYSKFFDYHFALFHHLHHSEEAAARVGMKSKPEHYYFPAQYNNHPGDFPVTYFGFDPSVTKEQVMDCLRNFNNFDTRITELSRAFRLQLGTGWYTPPAVIHAPGSLLTYEPQWNSDVMSCWENIVSGEPQDYSIFANCLPEGKENDLDYIFSLIDWDLSVCPDYRERFFRPPVPCCEGPTYKENWICYGNKYVGAKELTIYPGQTAVIKDQAAYGCIVVQGYGEFGAYQCEAANMLRFGQLSADEYFVSEDAAKKGVTIVNKARFEPLVVLKHFAPNCGMPV